MHACSGYLTFPLRKQFTLIFLLSVTVSCIKSFEPVIESDAADRYVVSGMVSDKEGWHEVEVSVTSPIQSPAYRPLTGCQVRILDDKGNVFQAEEFAAGHYHAFIQQQYLSPETSYKVAVTTPEGDVLESDFDKMSKGPPIDSVYYAVKKIPTGDPSISNSVMQFYVDLDATGGDNSRYYKWEIIETWEYTAKHPVEYFYDGDFHTVKPPDSTNYVCWVTTTAKNVYTVSTTNLSQNAYRQFPLHWIDGNTSRLGVLYSMLVRQQALSEAAYNYWEQVRANSNDGGGLYEKQPLAVKGNIRSLTNDNKYALGFFYAAAISERRYFYKPVEGIDPAFRKKFCSEDPLGKFGWKEFSKSDYPVYYYFNLQGILRILSLDCVDCRAQGGTTVKPDFWPAQPDQAVY